MASNCFLGSNLHRLHLEGELYQATRRKESEHASLAIAQADNPVSQMTINISDSEVHHPCSKHLGNSFSGLSLLILYYYFLMILILFFS